MLEPEKGRKKVKEEGRAGSRGGGLGGCEEITRELAKPSLLEKQHLMQPKVERGG